MQVYPAAAVGPYPIFYLGDQQGRYFGRRRQAEKIRTLIQESFQIWTSQDKIADLSEHIVYLARWNTVTFEIDEPYLFESIYDFVGRFPLL